MEAEEINKESKNEYKDQIDCSATKVKLTPELHRLLNRDLSKKLDQKLDPLQQSVNDIKANLTTQEHRIEEVMKIRDENTKLHQCCNHIEKPDNNK